MINVSLSKEVLIIFMNVTYYSKTMLELVQSEFSCIKGNSGQEKSMKE